jgi:hypothetical protein
VVIDFLADEDDPVFQQTAVNVVGTLSPARLLDDDRDEY